MWILPRQLHTSAFVPDTEALISDSTEQSEICAQSLLARSKPSPARTWSQRWKRDSWTQHLSGRILKPSHGQTFVTAWTSSLAATRANPSAQPASGSVPKTPDTSGRLSQPELLQCDQVSVFLKTSRDISALGYPTLSKTWADWVTERRGAWRARVSAARLIRGSESGSWPTARTNDSAAGRPNDGKDRIGKNGDRFGINLSDKVIAEQNWPTANARDWKDHGPTQGNRTNPNLGTAVHRHGQAAPASSSSLGSRQGLWPTARSLDGSVNESLETWTARHHRKEAEGINLHRPLPIAVMQEQQKQWATPRSGKTTDENPETWALRQAKGDVATMPLTAAIWRVRR